MTVFTKHPTRLSAPTSSRDGGKQLRCIVRRLGGVTEKGVTTNESTFLLGDFPSLTPEFLTHGFEFRTYFPCSICT